MYDLAEFDKRISLYSPTEAVSSTGAVSVSWTLVGSYWAKMDRENGTEQLKRDREVNRTVTDFILRSQITVTDEYKLEYNSTTYDILSVEEDGRFFQRVKAVRI